MIKIEFIEILEKEKEEIKKYFLYDVNGTKRKKKTIEKYEKIYKEIEKYIFMTPLEIKNIIKVKGKIEKIKIGNNRVFEKNVYNDIIDFFKTNKGFKEVIYDFYFEKLKLKICPYCNDTPIYLVNPKNRKSRYQNFQLDHIYPKNIYPYMALSLYNLVPVCNFCNLKKGYEISLPNIYLDEIDYNYYLEDYKELKVKINENMNLQEILYLEERYNINHHLRYIESLLEKIQYYSKDRIQDLKETGFFDDVYEEKFNEQWLINKVYSKIRETANNPKISRYKLTRSILEQFKLFELLDF